MKFIYSILFFLLLIGCKERVSENNTAILDDITPQADPVIINRTLDKNLSKFKELPSFAHHINELIFCKGDKLIPSSKILQLQNEHLVCSDSQNIQLDSFAYNFAQFSGKEGPVSWKTQYTFLHDDIAPIVLITNETNIISENNKELSSLKKNALGTDYSIRFWVWKRKAGHWENITESTFESNVYENLMAHFPFFEKDKSLSTDIPKGIFLKEKKYSSIALENNIDNWLTWFGTKDLSKLIFGLQMEGDDILFQCSKQKSIRWEWDGVNYTIKDLPSKLEWKEIN